MESAKFRVDRRLTIAKIVGVVVFAVLAVVLVSDPIRTAGAAIGAAVLAGYALRDLVAPIRLAADQTGLTIVVRFASHHRLGWSDIVRIRLDRHSRWGLQADFLEIDSGQQLYLFSHYDLGMSPAEALTAVEAIRSAAG
jgi:hypothetical protein